MDSQLVKQISDYFSTQPVLKAWVFGSFARNEESAESDVDLMVDLDHSQPVGLRFFGMWNELERLLGRNVDLVTEDGLADYARESYNRDKILVYERTN
jgi:predicted nucleotidyltransferase